MVEVFGSLDNREKAALIWLGLALAAAVRSKAIRSSLVSIFRTLLSRPLLMVLGTMVGYVSLTVFGLQQFGFWQITLTKDTVIWFLGPAMLMVFNYTQANKDADYFKKALFAYLGLAVIVQFFINFYVFNLFVELMLLPFIFLVAALTAVSETRAEFAPVKRVAALMMSAIVLAMLSYALTMLIRDATSFASDDTLKSFILPLVLTALFLPFIYGLAIYSGYELIFVRIKLWITDNELAGYIRRQIFGACLFRLSRVNRFLNGYAARLTTVKSKSDAIELLAEFKGRLPGQVP